MTTLLRNTTLATVTSVFAFSAQAETILIEYDFQGSAIEQDSFLAEMPGVDFLGGGELGNEPDGLDDIGFFAVRQSQEDAANELEAIFGEPVLDEFESDYYEAGLVNLVPQSFEEYAASCDLYSDCHLPSGNRIVSAGFAREFESNTPFRYQNGDTVEISPLVEFGPFGGDPMLGIDEVTLYSPFDEYLEVGETAIFGFMFEVMTESILPLDSEEFGPEDYLYCEEFDLVDRNQPTDDEYCDPYYTQYATYFGFVEITRGSIVPGMIGFNTTAGEGALIPASDISAVPLPASSLLLLAGLGGLAISGRRRKV